MKKPLLLLSILFIGAFAFTSCNKNLKDDIKDLRNEVDSLNKYNSELDQKVKDLEEAIGSNEPIIATSTFVDDDGKTRTIKGSFRFKSSGVSTHVARQMPDGNYDIYVERFGDMEWSAGAWIAFHYNPSTKTISNKRMGHYWDDFDPYANRTRYDETAYNGTGLHISFTLHKLDLSTGALSITCNATAAADYTSQYNSYCPNPGQPMSTHFDFNGQLRVFAYED